MISSVGWVRSGAARAEPIQDDDGDGDDERELAEQSAASAARRAARAQATGDDAELDETIARFGLDDYDDDDDPRDAGALPMFSRKALMFHRSNDDDPFVTLKDADDEDEDADDLIISPHDKLVLAARSEEDVSNIEVHVYEEEGHNLYPHHDILLPSFPLCLEWLGYRPHAAPSASTGANLVCVGTFEPQIEIWDLDVLNTFAPVAVLGGEYTRPLAPDGAGSGKKKKGKKKERAGAAPDPALGHVDAVMALSWNRMQTNALASASADRTVRIWDLGSPGLACVQTLSHHADKVQAVRWHPSEPTVLLSGGFDKVAAVVDVRAQAAFRPFALSADVESVSWLSDTHLLVSTEDGHVDCFDARSSGRLWTLSAHDTAATGLSCNPGCAGMFATCSTDKLVKVWSVEGERPQLLVAKDLSLGPLFDVAFCVDAPHLLAAGGGNGKVGVWDATDSATVCAKLGVQRRETPLGGSVVASGMEALDVHSSESEDDEPSAAAAIAAERPKAASKKAAAKDKVKAAAKKSAKKK